MRALGRLIFCAGLLVISRFFSFTKCHECGLEDGACCCPNGTPLPEDRFQLSK